MERVILHCDLNSFFASVELLNNPELRDKPVAVCGNTQERHGIVLAKNDVAKRYGIITGEPVIHAKNKCRGLITIPPHYEQYLNFSRKVKDIYYKYTDQVESFGIDECWLDVTAIKNYSDLLGVGRQTANKLKRRGVKTIGQLASLDSSMLELWFGKCGLLLWVYANGLDNSPVSNIEFTAPIKPIGHGTTTTKDLRNNIEVYDIFTE